MCVMWIKALCICAIESVDWSDIIELYLERAYLEKWEMRLVGIGDDGKWQISLRVDDAPRSVYIRTRVLCPSVTFQ